MQEEGLLGLVLDIEVLLRLGRVWALLVPMSDLMTSCTSGFLLQGLDRDLVGLASTDLVRPLSRTSTLGSSETSTGVPVSSIASGQSLGPLGVVHRLEGSSETFLGVLSDHGREDFLGLVFVEHVRRGDRLAVRILIQFPEGAQENLDILLVRRLGFQALLGELRGLVHHHDRLGLPRLLLGSAPGQVGFLYADPFFHGLLRQLALGVVHHEFHLVRGNL